MISHTEFVNDLINAIRKGNLKTVKALLDVKDRSNWRQLTHTYEIVCLALKYKNVEIAKTLIINGANVNCQNNETQDTPLHYAILTNSFELVELLLNKGASVNMKNVNNEYPIHIAAKLASSEIIKILVNKIGEIYSCGIYKQPIDIYGYTPLYYVLKRGLNDIAKLFLQTDIGIEDNRSFNIAIQDNYTDVVEEFIQCGFDINNLNFGQTALHMALFNKKQDIINLLLKHKADVNVENTRGMTVMHIAAKNNNEEFIELFLQNGANVNATDDCGNSVLYHGVYNNCVNIVDILLEYDADIYSKNNNGDSVLFAAVTNKNREMCRLLLSRNVDVNLINKAGKTVLFEAVKKGSTDIIKILLDHGANINHKSKEGESVLYNAVYSGNEEICKLLLDNGADVQIENKCGETVLYDAVRKGHENIINLLLQYDTNLHHKNGKGETIFYSAIDCENENIFLFLLDKGIDINVKNNLGETVLHKIIIRRSRIILHELETVFEMLINRGADINAKSFAEVTVLETAIDCNDEKIVQILLKYEVDINLHSPLHFKTGWNYLKPYLVKLKFTGARLNSEYLKFIENHDILLECECRNEFEKIKMEKIETVTYYDVMKQDVSQLAYYLKNKHVAESLLCSENYKNQFPIYADMLRWKIERAYERRKLFDFSTQILYSLFNFKIPYNIIDNILKYMKISDLYFLQNRSK